MYFRWFSFFIFIIYLGGILILFSYIIRLINSSKPILKENKFIKIFLIIFFILNLFKEKTRNIEITTRKFIKIIISSFRTTLIKIRIYLIIFLFLIIVIVVFLTEINKGNIRKL